MWSHRFAVGVCLLLVLDLCLGATSICNKADTTYTCPDSYVCCESSICCYDYPKMIAPWLTLIGVSTIFLSVAVLSCMKCHSIGIFKEKQKFSSKATPMRTTSSMKRPANRRDDDVCPAKIPFDEERELSKDYRTSDQYVKDNECRPPRSSRYSQKRKPKQQPAAHPCEEDGACADDTIPFEEETDFSYRASDQYKREDERRPPRSTRSSSQKRKQKQRQRRPSHLCDDGHPIDTDSECKHCNNCYKMRRPDGKLKRFRDLGMDLP